MFHSQGFSKKKCETMMRKADMNNLLPETLLRASDMEIEADLAELRAGIDLMQVEGGVDDVFQDVVEVSYDQTMTKDDKKMCGKCVRRGQCS